MLVKESVPSPREVQLSEHGWLYIGLNEVDSHSSALSTIVITNGKRNISPECSPVPKPIDESTPSVTHQPIS